MGAATVTLAGVGVSSAASSPSGANHLAADLLSADGSIAAARSQGDAILEG